MKTMLTSGWAHPAKAALRVALMGAACFTAIAPLEDGAVSAAVPARAVQADRFGDGLPEVAARVALGPGGRDIRLAGDLIEGVAARVAALLAANPGVERIHLTSDGGLVDEAVALGALVAERRLATYVPDACASACTLVFVRGRARYLATGAQLGFHAPYELGPDGRIETVDPAAERAAYLAAGLASDFVARTLSVAPADIWTPEPSRLREAGVVTEMVGSDRFPDSTLDADPSPQAARAEVLRNLPILSGLDPGAVDAIATWYREGYLAGRTEAQALAGLRERASAALRQRLRAVDDASIRALGRLVLADKAEAETCHALAQGDLVALDEALRRVRAGAPGLASLLARRSSDMQVMSPGDDTPRRAASLVHHAARPACAKPIAALRRALAQSRPGAAGSLRAILLGDPPTTIASAALP
ncbi:hypothetical protein [Methylobacterium brachiatum]|uniref:hypothetical protein n=1 Tax=Methylobacterium brachiatum TaxID=269660 RepID=UPI000EFC596A|nr:hypothetical protein [Methylobacterium brachiatum]AYO81000.1 hypothetical protein EBB05_00950 [Methylobacterium brachiatum]